ncbi:hypothetical protein VUR80DRAFT_7092 [Thermomyces stellatus]
MEQPVQAVSEGVWLSRLATYIAMALRDRETVFYVRLGWGVSEECDHTRRALWNNLGTLSRTGAYRASGTRLQLSRHRCPRCGGCSVAGKTLIVDATSQRRNSGTSSAVVAGAEPQRFPERKNLKCLGPRFHQVRGAPSNIFRSSAMGSLRP